MGFVCGFIFVFMDVGVLIKKFVSGVVMGLIKEGDEICIFIDIQGIEDFFGDMDFKVVGIDFGIIVL